jgi:hypothetical protein
MQENHIKLTILVRGLTELLVHVSGRNIASLENMLDDLNDKKNDN